MSHTVETHVNVPILPIRGDGELTTVSTHRIGHISLISEPARTFSHHTVGVLVERERVCHIAIERLIPVFAMMKSIDLPTGRHIYIAPRSIIVIFFTHGYLHLARIRYPIELPCTIQRLIIWRCCHIILDHLGFICHRNGNCMRFLAVDAGYCHVIPFFTSLGIGCCNTH